MIVILAAWLVLSGFGRGSNSLTISFQLGRVSAVVEIGSPAERPILVALKGDRRGQ
jgi:hypothetical protein